MEPPVSRPQTGSLVGEDPLHDRQQQDGDPRREIEPADGWHDTADGVEDGRGDPVDEPNGGVRQIDARDPTHDNARDQKHVHRLKYDPECP
jgi:hypothetical protein